MKPPPRIVSWCFMQHVQAWYRLETSPPSQQHVFWPWLQHSPALNCKGLQTPSQHECPGSKRYFAHTKSLNNPESPLHHNSSKEKGTKEKLYNQLIFMFTTMFQGQAACFWLLLGLGTENELICFSKLQGLPAMLNEMIRPSLHVAFFSEGAPWRMKWKKCCAFQVSCAAIRLRKRNSSCVELYTRSKIAQYDLDYPQKNIMSRCRRVVRCLHMLHPLQLFLQAPVL